MENWKASLTRVHPFLARPVGILVEGEVSGELHSKFSIDRLIRCDFISSLDFPHRFPIALVVECHAADVFVVEELTA